MATVTQKEAMTIDDDDGDVGGTLVILPVAETSPPRMMTMGLRRIFKQGPPKPANEEHHEHGQEHGEDDGVAGGGPTSVAAASWAPSGDLPARVRALSLGTPGPAIFRVALPTPGSAF